MYFHIDEISSVQVSGISHTFAFSCVVILKFLTKLRISEFNLVCIASKTVLAKIFVLEKSQVSVDSVERLVKNGLGSKSVLNYASVYHSNTIFDTLGIFSRNRPLRRVDSWSRYGRISVKCLFQGHLMLTFQLAAVQISG